MAADVRMGCTFASKTKEIILYDFLTDFKRLNERLVRKPFSLPTTSTGLQELRCFTYATALDLNMGYYTIRLDPDASRICTINFPLGNTPISDYRWILQVLLYIKNENVRANENLGKVRRRLINKISSYQGKPQ